VVDRSPPEAIARAIKKVTQNPGLRIEPGSQALWKLYKAPSHTLKRKELEEGLELDLHFGWFCRRVAEELGANNPDSLALVDYSTDGDGAQVLTLKPAVVEAMKFGRAGR
jgi:hypothetical protein